MGRRVNRQKKEARKEDVKERMDDIQRRYLLTPWTRVLAEKLTVSQLVKKFPAFYGTQMFITVLTSARHLSLPSVRSIQSISSHPTSRRSILILPSHQRMGLLGGLFPAVFPTNILYTPLLFPNTCYMPRLSHSS